MHSTSAYDVVCHAFPNYQNCERCIFQIQIKFISILLEEWLRFKVFEYIENLDISIWGHIKIKNNLICYIDYS